MSARPAPRVTPRWPVEHFHPRTDTVTLDYSTDTPGLMSYTDVDIQDIDEHGEIRRITSAPSTVIPGGVSLTYPSQDALFAHVALMRRYREKLAAFDQPTEQGSEVRGQGLTPNPQSLAPASEPARLVFGRMSARAGRKLARQAEQAAQQEALL